MDKKILDPRYKIKPDLLKALIKLRIKGLTQRKLAKSFGISQSYVSRLCSKHIPQINEECEDGGRKESWA